MTLTATTAGSVELIDGAALYEYAPQTTDPIYWVQFLSEALTNRYQTHRRFDDYYQIGRASCRERVFNWV